MNKNESINEGKFAVPFKNVYLILGGLLLMVLGYVLMAGGGPSSPEVFNGKAMFSFTRIVLAPLLILTGFVVEIVAIMYKPGKK